MSQQTLQGKSTQAQKLGVCCAAESSAVPTIYERKHQRRDARWGSQGCRLQRSIMRRWGKTHRLQRWGLPARWGWRLQCGPAESAHPLRGRPPREQRLRLAAPLQPCPLPGWQPCLPTACMSEHGMG